MMRGGGPAPPAESQPLSDKRAFYSQPEVTASYERQRFGGASGARVNQREIEIALAMLPTWGQILDVACGTGRLSVAIAERDQPVVGVDFSPSMARMTAERGIRAAISDAFVLPFADDTFDSVVSLRFAFHYRELGPLLRELRRVVRPGGVIVFDTYSWSPRSLIPLGASRWGGVVHLHQRREVARIGAGLGLHLAEIQPCFLFSPYLYRLSPLPLTRAFEKLERVVPRSMLCRAFWKFIAG